MKVNSTFQHYQVHRLRMQNRQWVDLRPFDAMFFPVDRDGALMTVLRPQIILQGLVGMADLFGRSKDAQVIYGIEYAIMTALDSQVWVEDFTHQFTTPVVIHSPNELRVFQLEPSKGHLFTLRYLDDIYRTKKFGQLKGAQFCC